MKNTLWFDAFYLETFGLIAGFLLILLVPLYFLKKKSVTLQGSWASVISWLYAVPVLFFFIGLKSPGPKIFITLISIYSAKTFFKMLGMYHRHIFVYTTYFGIAFCAISVHLEHDLLFFLAPALMLFFYCIIPVFLNHTENMIQYISVSFLTFCLFGWGLIFSTKVLSVDSGVYLLFYLYILSEFSGNLTNLSSNFLPGSIIAPKVSTKVKWSGMVFSFIFTMLLAWAFRRLLFNTEEKYWIMAGFICFFSALIGEWALSAFRRDLGLKDQGVFIIGRGDLLSRTNRMVFSYPAFTFFIWALGDIGFKL